MVNSNSIQLEKFMVNGSIFINSVWIEAHKDKCNGTEKSK